MVKKQCQPQWFKTFPWLHYEVEKDRFFLFFQFFEDALLTEHSKDSAYVSTGFNNWKKVPKCFKTHENSKCYKVALTNQVTVPKYGDKASILKDGN